MTDLHDKEKGKKIRTFPCPICKGRGGWKEVVFDDGSGPWDECGYCNGEALIDIDGPIHMDKKRLNIALKAIQYFKPAQEEWSWKELRELGLKIENLLK